MTGKRDGGANGRRLLGLGPLRLEVSHCSGVQRSDGLSRGVIWVAPGPKAGSVAGGEAPNPRSGRLHLALTFGRANPDGTRNPLTGSGSG